MEEREPGGIKTGSVVAGTAGAAVGNIAGRLIK